MAYHLAIELQGLPPTANSSMRGHWKAGFYARKKWKDLVMQAAKLQGLPPTPLTTAKITLTRYSSSEPDFDGLVTSFKPCLDALTTIGVILDDKMSVIGAPTYIWEKCMRGKGRIKIEVAG